jgi:hypothetical protein
MNFCNPGVHYETPCVKVYVKEVVSVDWIHLAQDRDSMWPVVKTVIKFWVPQNGGGFLE